MLTIKNTPRCVHKGRYHRASDHWYRLQSLEDRLLLSGTFWKADSDPTKHNNYFWIDANWTNGRPSATKYANFTASPANPVVMSTPPGDPAATIAGITLTEGVTVMLVTVGQDNVAGWILLGTDSSLTIDGSAKLISGDIEVNEAELNVVENAHIDCQNLKIADGVDNGTLIVGDSARIDVRGNTIFGNPSATAAGIAAVTIAGSAYVQPYSNASVDGVDYLDGNLERSSSVFVSGSWEVEGSGSLSVAQDCQIAAGDGGWISAVNATSGIQLAGILSGSCVVQGNVTAGSTGVLHAGDDLSPTGNLLIHGNLTMSSGGAIETFWEPEGSPRSSAVMVSGTATMGGALTLHLTNFNALAVEGPTFEAVDYYAILVASAFSGSFNNLSYIPANMDADFPLGPQYWLMSTVSAHLNGNAPLGSDGYDLDTGTGQALVLQSGYD
ncbi:MAG TPA: hypothetical protein VHM90_08845 [Phycisphaerae bacterium]|nr:hypothetical protein [Phycisphaerae bacterium]